MADVTSIYIISGMHKAEMFLKRIRTLPFELLQNSLPNPSMISRLSSSLER